MVRLLLGQLGEREIPMEQSIRFENHRGLTLVADLLRPDDHAAVPVVVFAHGWGSSRRSLRNRRIAEALAREGIGALLLDFSGHGESEGSPDDVTLEDQVDDLRAAIDLLAAREAVTRIGVAGSSSGGAVAVAEAAGDARVAALVLRAPSASTRFTQAAGLCAPTLLIQGENDPLFERNRELAKALSCEQRLLLVPGAGHLFEEPGTFELALRETVAWFQRWLAGAGCRAGGECPRVGCELRVGGGPERRPFASRAEAGRMLAARLDRYRGAETLVLGLPRGGIAVAEPIALSLGSDLDVLVSRKLRAPSQPELAIGALAEGEVVLWNEEICYALGLTDEDRAWELDRVRHELDERVAAYRAVRPRAELKDRTVVLVDDGVATGATLKAAVSAAQREGAAGIVVALPGGPRETLEQVAGLPGVCEVVALVAPEAFWAVGQLYESFPQVATEEVAAALRRARERRRGSSGDRPRTGSSRSGEGPTAPRGGRS